MSKARILIDMMKEQSVANLGAIPGPALGVVSHSGTSYSLDIPKITKKKKKKKEGIKGRKIYNQGKEYDIDIGPGKKTLSGVYGTPH